MDPLTHGLLGGVAAQSFRRKPIPAYTPWVAAAGAMAPDLDFLIRSSDNPMLFFEYHRNFTHSLIFIPVGGLIVAGLIWLLLRRKPRFLGLYAAATIGFATHGLLDSCTSYGTMLLWPFSRARISWDIINIVDPIYTVLLLAGLIIAWKRSAPGAARIFWAMSFFYLGFGLYQYQRVSNAQQALIALRGHQAQQNKVIPTFGNLIVWRSLYRSTDIIYVDALRAIPGKGVEYWEGGKISAFQIHSALQAIPATSTLAKDLATFDWFTEHWASNLLGERLLGDMRFSALPNSLMPFWRVQANLHAPWEHVRMLSSSTYFRRQLKPFWEFIQGKAPGLKPL